MISRTVSRRKFLFQTSALSVAGIVLALNSERIKPERVVANENLMVNGSGFFIVDGWVLRVEDIAG